MRVLCINNQPIQGFGNTDLHLIQEGRVYNVISKADGGYNIGIKNSASIYANVDCYWGVDRFIECKEEFCELDGLMNELWDKDKPNEKK